jgi:hypothetical protein
MPAPARTSGRLLACRRSDSPASGPVALIAPSRAILSAGVQIAKVARVVPIAAASGPAVALLLAGSVAWLALGESRSPLGCSRSLARYETLVTSERMLVAEPREVSQGAATLAVGETAPAPRLQEVAALGLS